MTKKLLLLVFASSFLAVVNCFSQGVVFDSLKANTGTNKTLIFTPVANYGHKIYGFDAGTRTDLRFASRANTPIWSDIMTITSAGNVGIGTISPTEKLTLNGNILLASQNFIGFALSNSFTYDGKTQPHYGMQWAPDSWSGAGNSLWMASYGGLKFFTTGVLRIAVNDAGNTGIGTASPVVKLSVYGGNNNEGAISIQSGVDSRFYIQEGDNMLKIGGVNSGVGVINVINTGNVGIGTTTTGSNKLAVEGTIAARKIKVTQASPWPDFVFDSSYQLPSLWEIKNYVTVNKHLPDVPSAKEVEKNGQDLGEMNRVLLQKVEELTLHLIEMNEKKSDLEKRVEILERLYNQEHPSSH
jgi:hypothetical protein